MNINIHMARMAKLGFIAAMSPLAVALQPLAAADIVYRARQTLRDEFEAIDARTQVKPEQRASDDRQWMHVPDPNHR